MGCCVQVGGVPAVLKYLLQKGFLHGDCLTVTGKQSRSQPSCCLGHWGVSLHVDEVVI